METPTWPQEGKQLTTEHYYAHIERRIALLEEQLHAWKLQAQANATSNPEQVETAQFHINDINEQLSSLRALLEHTPISTE